jgi:hypothetical protein
MAPAATVKDLLRIPTKKQASCRYLFALLLSQTNKFCHQEFPLGATHSLPAAGQPSFKQLLSSTDIMLRAPWGWICNKG